MMGPVPQPNVIGPKPSELRLYALNEWNDDAAYVMEEAKREGTEKANEAKAKKPRWGFRFGFRKASSHHDAHRSK
ncbi:MAG: hypothetical protein A4E32_01479 [Methanomassiliicoccales archaeon PtaU1.Bin124]|nr:MAG: hypothetical protein A4E32_01479 [Methanomassiliicoccales archaeon PtaU1.Bin124]